ncbi:MAG: Transposase IS3/IS911 family protein, partial [Actinobacteria bacterium 66_15]
MPSPNTKYSPEVREQTAEFIISSGRSATSIAEEMGIDVNTVCKWVREYRRSHDMPTYAEEKGIKTPPPASTAEFRLKRPGFRVGSFIWMPRLAWRLPDCIARVPGAA